MRNDNKTANLPFGLTLDDIAALADIVKEKELGEITLKDEVDKLVIKSRPLPPHPPCSAGTTGVTGTLAAPSAAAERPVQTAEKARPKGNVVKAPIVGTYYSSPAPDKPPFVTVGQRVRKGDTLMIIETMKLMNEIQSEFDGEVREIIAKNGEAVEFDQPIMIIG